MDERKGVFYANEIVFQNPFYNHFIWFQSRFILQFFLKLHQIQPNRLVHPSSHLSAHRGHHQFAGGAYPVSYTHLVQGAREALRIKKDTYNKINDIAKSRRGSLSVGLTPGRGIRMFTSIYPVLHKDCPELAVTPLEMTVHSQQKAIARGELDIGFMIMGARQRGSDSYITCLLYTSRCV